MTQSRRNKGNIARLRAQKELELDGWMVGVVERTGRFIKQKDLYGLFDLLAIKQGRIMFLQIAHESHPHLHKPLLEFANKHSHKNLLVSQWIWFKRKGWKKHFYEKENNRWCGVQFEKSKK